MDQQKVTALKHILQQNPFSEVALIYELGKKIGPQNLYVGNSLPIRELDLVTGLIEADQGPRKVSANRGANGIDGQVSSFLGLAESQKENWCLIGDLTAMYDLSSLWISPFLKDLKLRIVVINNRGGQIFKNIFKKDIFVNSHNLHFLHWAQMWNWDYQEWTKIPESTNSLGQHIVVELLPDAQQSENFWSEYQKL